MTEKKRKTLGFIIYLQKSSCILSFFWNSTYPEEVLNKNGDKSIHHNLFITQDDNSIMCGHYCIALIEYILGGKTLLDYTNLFSPND